MSALGSSRARLQQLGGNRSQSGIRGAYAERPITSCAQLLITKKPVDFDFVAIDASGLVGGALRLAKHATAESRRHREVGRHVLQGLMQILKRINCRQSLLIAFDGAEPLAKAALARRSAHTRRLESRLARLPGTSLMQGVEERLVKMMPGRQHMPREVVIAGTGVAGSVEAKMTAWALDLACRADFHGGSGQSLALVGAQELYMNALALTPYYTVSSLVQGVGADVKQISLAAVLEWLGLEQLAADGRSRVVAHARTDAALLLLLCNGSAATDLPAVANLRFAIVFSAYQEQILAPASAQEGDGNGSRGAYGTSESDASTASLRNTTGECFLFRDLPGNKLELNVEALLKVLRSSVPASTTTAAPREDGTADAYLELVLQSHATLCLGFTPNPLYVPGDALLSPGSCACAVVAPSTSAPTTAAGSISISAAQLYGHLMHLCGQHVGGCARRCATQLTGNSRKVMGQEYEQQQQQLEGKDESGEERGKVEATHDPFFSPTQPLTAAEYTILSNGATPGVEAALQLYFNQTTSNPTSSWNNQHQHHSHHPAPELVKRITTLDTGAALALTRQVLSLANPRRPHRCCCLSPAYYWGQSPKTKAWHMAYIDIGTHAAAKEVRRVRNELAGISMTLQASEEGPAMYDTATKRWQPVPHFPILEGDADEEMSTSTSAAAGVGSSLKVLTWNVMFDRYSGQPTPLGMPGIDWCSPQRYPVLAKLIAAEDADVVGMQEVEPDFLSFLAQQSWCRERYVLSCTPGSAAVNPWGIATLLHRRRLPILGVTHVNVPAWSGHTSLMPIATLRMKHGPVHVAAVHLLAPFTKSNENARTAQDTALRQRLTKGISGGEDCVAMGDYNDWPTNKFEMPPETQYRDCWPLVHSRDPGNTMDETNTFCKLKIESIFFGRADKVFLRSQQLRPVEAHLVGTKSVNAENGHTGAPAYLFPSDHYGVSVTFSL